MLLTPSTKMGSEPRMTPMGPPPPHIPGQRRQEAGAFGRNNSEFVTLSFLLSVNMSRNALRNSDPGTSVTKAQKGIATTLPWLTTWKKNHPI